MAAPLLEISVIIYVVYAIVKSIIRYKENNHTQNRGLLEDMRAILEPKLGKGLLVEVVITEVVKD